MQWFNNANEALINDKIVKALGVINLFQTENWSRVKGDSNWINAVFVDSEYPSIANYFSFTYITKNLFDLLDFTFQLVDIKFSNTETKVPTLSFKIQAIK